MRIDEPEERDLSTQPLSISLTETVVNSSGVELVGELAEFAIDQVLDAGLIKDIPFVGWLAKGYSAYTSVSDRILLNKILRFLGQLNSLNSPEKEAFVSKMRKDPAYARKVGEHILMALNRIDDPYKAELIAACFDHFLTGDLTFDDLAELTQLIDRLLVSDLKALQQDGTGFGYQQWSRFVAAGTANFDLAESCIEGEGPSLSYHLSQAGEWLRRIMRDELRSHLSAIAQMKRNMEKTFGG